MLMQINRICLYSSQLADINITACLRKPLICSKCNYSTTQFMFDAVHVTVISNQHMQYLNLCSLFIRCRILHAQNHVLSRDLDVTRNSYVTMRTTLVMWSESYINLCCIVIREVSFISEASNFGILVRTLLSI